MPLPKPPNKICSVVFLFLEHFDASKSEKFDFYQPIFLLLCVFPYWAALVPYGFVELLHSCGTVSPHLLRYVTVNIQGERRCILSLSKKGINCVIANPPTYLKNSFIATNCVKIIDWDCIGITAIPVYRENTPSALLQISRWLFAAEFGGCFAVLL